jgi:hypothetical protein
MNCTSHSLSLALEACRKKLIISPLEKNNSSSSSRCRKSRLRPWGSVMLARDTLYPQKLALTSPTSGGRSVGVVRSRTQAMEFCFRGSSSSNSSNSSSVSSSSRWQPKVRLVAFEPRSHSTRPAIVSENRNIAVGFQPRNPLPVNSRRCNNALLWKKAAQLYPFTKSVITRLGLSRTWTEKEGSV